MILIDELNQTALCSETTRIATAPSPDDVYNKAQKAKPGTLYAVLADLHDFPI